MPNELDEFLADLKPFAEETVVWGEGTIRLKVRSYPYSRLPPLRFISSVRCIVLGGLEVLCVRNPLEVHIVPGGRIENGEEIPDALRRELLEETGWDIVDEFLLGFMHFAPQTGPTQPDFLQLVFAAQANGFRHGAKLDDDYEIESEFVSIEKARALDLSDSQIAFLEAALNT